MNELCRNLFYGEECKARNPSLDKNIELVGVFFMDWRVNLKTKPG